MNPESTRSLVPRLVAADPPYNAHLATDAGAGLLAAGLVLVAAAWLADARSVRLGLLAFAAFTVPHAVYHTANPAPGLSGTEDVQNVILLLAIVLATVVLFAGTVRRPLEASGGTTATPTAEAAGSA